MKKLFLLLFPTAILIALVQFGLFLPWASDAVVAACIVIALCFTVPLGFLLRDMFRN